MSVTYNPEAWLDSRTVIVSWTGTASLYYVYRDGILVTTTAETRATFEVDPGDQLLVEILDDPETEPTPVYPGRIWLCWYGVENGARYRVDESVDGVWTERASILDEGQGYFRWRTRFLEDDEEHLFRVVPVGQNGADGEAREYRYYMARYPDEPRATYAYDDQTRKITIALEEEAGAEGSEEMKQVKWLTDNGSGAIAYPIAETGPYEIREVRLPLAAVKDMVDFQIKRGPAAGDTMDAVLWSPPLDPSSGKAETDCLVFRPGNPIAISANTAVTIVWPNSGAIAWELEIVIETI